MKNLNKKCPDANTLAEFVEGRLLEKEHAELCEHIAVCPECRDLCAFAVMALGKKSPQLAARRKANIRQNVKREAFALNALQAKWQMFSGKLQDVFSKVETAEVLAAGENAATITFACAADTPAEYNWKMQLAIPAVPDGDLPIRIRSAKEPALNGKLIFCGNELAVKNGRTAIAYETLKNSFANPEVAFIFTNNTRIAGFPEL